MTTFGNGLDDSKRDRFAPSLAVGVGLLGMFMAHYPMIVSGFRLVQTDRIDTRLINYILEHNYLWYRGETNHVEFWHAPFFYPARNVTAYSDSFLGIAPLYAMFRAVGCAPDTAFQSWLMSLSVLNYAVMFHFLRCRMRMSVAAASAGAFVFAFGAPRINRLATPQHLTQFLSLITVDALFGIFDIRAGPSWRRGVLWIVATAGVIAQLTSGFYLGWFLVLALGTATVVVVWMPTIRVAFVVKLRRDAPWIVVCAIVGGLILRAWVAHHRAAEFSSRFLPFVRAFLPHPGTWFYQGPRSWFGSWTAGLTDFTYPSTEVEQRLGLGLVTTSVCLLGLVAGRKRPSVRLLVMVALVLFLSLTFVPPFLMMGLKYGLVAGSMVVAFNGRRDRPEVYFFVFGLMLVALQSTMMPRGIVKGFGLFALPLAVAALSKWRGEPLARLFPGLLALGLLVTLCPAPFVLWIGSVLGILFAAGAYYLGVRSRSSSYSGKTVALWTVPTVAMLITFGDQPRDLLPAALALPIAWLAQRVPDEILPSPWSLRRAIFIGLVITLMFDPDGNAWQFFYLHVPGASSMLYVSRVGLMMLIPAAIGFGFFIDTLGAKRRTLLALAICGVCLAEQGVWNLSFDKYENRRVIHTLARRVDRRSEAFYYSPVLSSAPYYQSNLDAMWAGLVCGTPTVNGYSGGTPIAFRPLENAVINDEFDDFWVRDRLKEWRSESARSVRSVNWIMGTESWDLDEILSDDRKPD